MTRLATTEAKTTANIWTFRTEGGHRRTTWLEAEWEPNLAPMSGVYAPSEDGAVQMLDFWAERVRQHYPDGLVPIHWSLVGEGIVERLPFQHEHHEYDREPEDFLDFFSWPEHGQTGEKLEWRELPVAEKQWNEEQAHKCGFIQEATGWKPSIYQPYIYLPALLATPRVRRGETALSWARSMAREGDVRAIQNGAGGST